jgi:tetratricopeptide (TPR) repeat protein
MMKKVLLLVITGIGIVLLYWSCCILEQSREALNWPQAKGHIISSLLTVHHYPKFIGLSVDPARWYGVEVRYEYAVGDGLYLSDRLAFQKSDVRSPKEALEVMNKYRRLHEVPVYYNLKNPQESVLQPGYIGDIYIPLILGAFLAFGGIFIFFRQSLEFNHEKSNYIHQGFIYQNQEKFEEALLEYTRAIRINPSSPLGYSHRGNLYLQQKSWDKAIADFNQALAIDPKDALIYFSLANAYLGKKQYDKALVNMNKTKENGFNVAPEILEDIKKKL